MAGTFPDLLDRRFRAITRAPLLPSLGCILVVQTLCPKIEAGGQLVARSRRFKDFVEMLFPHCPLDVCSSRCYSPLSLLLLFSSPLYVCLPASTLMRSSPINFNSPTWNASQQLRRLQLRRAQGQAAIRATAVWRVEGGRCGVLWFVLQTGTCRGGEGSAGEDERSVFNYGAHILPTPEGNPVDPQPALANHQASSRRLHGRQERGLRRHGVVDARSLSPPRMNETSKPHQDSPRLNPRLNHASPVVCHVSPCLFVPAQSPGIHSSHCCKAHRPKGIPHWPQTS